MSKDFRGALYHEHEQITYCTGSGHDLVYDWYPVQLIQYTTDVATRRQTIV